MSDKNNIKEEVTELVKPIVEHEAKSAFYKGKLIVVVTGKSLNYIRKKVQNAGKFSIRYIKELRKSK